LLLDAYALLPQIGPAIVLAYTAIETRIAQALDRLAALTGLNPLLWMWLTDRGDFTKDPSTAEQLDVLSRALAGKSLKDDTGLWESFQNLRTARNRFVHEGMASIGKQRLAVDDNRAQQLINGAELIIDWIENLLPEDERRPRAQSPNPVTVARLLFAVPSGEVDQGVAASEAADEGQQSEPPQEDTEVAADPSERPVDT